MANAEKVATKKAEKEALTAKQKSDAEIAAMEKAEKEALIAKWKAAAKEKE